MHTQTINLQEQQQMQDGKGERRGEERRENEDGDGSLRLCRQVRLEWEDCRSVVPSKTDGWLGRSLGRAL